MKGLTIQGFPNNGILTRYLDNFKIERNETANNLENGIWPTLSANGLVKRNVSYGSDDAALWVEASENVRVIKNELYDSPTGLEMTVSNSIVAKHNDVHDNVVGIGLYHALGAGIPPLQPLDRNGDWEISQNDVYNNNKVNDVTGGLVAQLPSGIGILLVGVDRVTLDRNQVDEQQDDGARHRRLVHWWPRARIRTRRPSRTRSRSTTSSRGTSSRTTHTIRIASLRRLRRTSRIVSLPAPGTTTTDNCFADNVYIAPSSGIPARDAGEQVQLA